MSWWKRKNCERGTLALEGAITFPVLAILLFGTVDIGIALERYFALSRVCYEGARAGAALAGLKEGTFNRKCTPSLNPSPYICEANPDMIHQELHAKITSLATMHGFTDLNHLDITTEYSPQIVSGGSIASDSNFVKVSMRIPVSMPFFTYMRLTDVHIRTEAVAPYLYRGS